MEITPTSTPEEIDQYIRETYPDIAPFMGDEAIKWILYAAAINDWDQREIDAALERTEYWQTHSPQARALDALLGSEPQVAQQVISAAMGVVSDLFARNGIQLEQATLDDLTLQALKGGIIGFNQQGQTFVNNQDSLNGLLAFSLGQGINNDEGLPAGEAAFNADRIRSIATGEFMLPITSREANEWSVRLLNGQATEESFRAEMTQRARERYPWLTQHLDAGGSVASATDRLRAVIADTLELDDDAVNLLDAKYKGVFEFYDGSAQAYRSMTLGEAAQWAREQPEWQKTRQGRAQGASVARGLVDMIEGRTG